MALCGGMRKSAQDCAGLIGTDRTGRMGRMEKMDRVDEMDRTDKLDRGPASVASSPYHPAAAHSVSRFTIYCAARGLARHVMLAAQAVLACLCYSYYGCFDNLHSGAGHNLSG